jgi:hypothetical protein
LLLTVWNRLLSEKIEDCHSAISLEPAKMRASEADSVGQADHSTLARMNGPHGQEFHFFTCFAP